MKGANETNFKDSIYYSVGRATDLTGRDRLIYRLFEIFPGALSWLTIISTVILSRFLPVWASIAVIIFDLYWLMKTMYLSIYLRQNWGRLRHHISLDWRERLNHMRYEHLYHMVILPFYKESYEVIVKSIESILSTEYDKKKMILVLAGEARAGKEAHEIGLRVEREYAAKFAHFLVTVHPADVPGEMAGKGSNISYAAEEARVNILDTHHIAYKDVIVSAFDIDTVVFSHYFECLTWHFLSVDNPYRVSFQPVPFYNNNLWYSPALSRVVAVSGTFWQMIQQERPERLATFSSHSVSFKTLYEIGYWQRNMVSEDSRIFWNALMAFDGDYAVVPMSYPVSMDANLAPTFWQTCKNIYKQQRRWAWGTENLPYLMMACLKNNNIPRSKKVRILAVQIENAWALATHPLLIFLLGWLPLLLGGYDFHATVLSYNLPVITRDLMDLAMVGLVVSAIISFTFLPPPPANVRIHTKLFMILQWILVPLTITIFSAIPALDAQTRLMLGKYMGFWVTPKHRV
jgi:cellulose synthase/poly-beta-1,6-N-acetylglucosamine synthase-like glycosyltransferase